MKKAGIHAGYYQFWIPVFTGMTTETKPIIDNESTTEILNNSSN